MARFDTLFQPLSLSDFRTGHYDKRPLHLARGDHGFYDGLLDLDEVDRILLSGGICFPAMRMLKAGKVVPKERYTVAPLSWGTGSVEGFIDRGAVVDLLGQGVTAVLESFQRVHDPTARLCSAFTQAFSAPAQANLYLTPPGSQGLTPHYDSQEVFVLQLSGTKQWSVFESAVSRPGRAQTCPAGGCEPGALVSEPELQPGDLLYLPRGTVHMARTTDRLSLHMTIGVIPYTWSNLFAELVGQLDQDPRFRQNLPLAAGTPSDPSPETEATFESLLRLFKEEADLDDAMDALGSRLIETRLPSLRGAIGELESRERVGLDTVLVMREGIFPRIEAGHDATVLHFNGRQTRFPGDAGVIARALVDGPFIVGDLPDPVGAVLSDDNRLAIARQLFDAGLLTFA